MRVRPQPFRRSTAERRPHVIERATAEPQAAEAPAPQQSPESGPELRAERRMRQAGGPEDQALYRCSCGFAFAADVSTSVACPHCGTGQAW